MAALAAAYRTVGLEVQVLGGEGRKGHMLVTFPVGGTYRVDVLKEPLNHPIVWMEFGPVIALQDAVALKMGALHDRALPRDVLYAHGAAAFFSHTDLIAACRAAIDEDFSLETLRDQLAFAAAYPDEAFSALEEQRNREWRYLEFLQVTSLITADIFMREIREPGIGPAQLTCPNTDTDHSDQSVPVLFAPLFLEGQGGPRKPSGQALSLHGIARAEVVHRQAGYRCIPSVTRANLSSSRGRST